MSKLPWRQVPQATRVTCRHGQRRHVSGQNLSPAWNGKQSVVGPAATGAGGKLRWQPAATGGGGSLLPTGLSHGRVTVLIARLRDDAADRLLSPGVRAYTAVTALLLPPN